MIDFIFDLPLVIIGPAIVGLLCLYAAIGLVVVQRHVLPHLRIRAEDSEFSGSMLQSVMVFYGLAAGMIAVNVWTSYGNASSIVSQEASAVATLWSNLVGYPEPIRSQFNEQLGDYLDYVIHEEWPQQQQGKFPYGAGKFTDRFRELLRAFEPATENQKVLFGETLRKFDQMIEVRRLRIDTLGTHLSGILWFIIIMGALISLSSSFFFKVEDLRVHGIQVVLLATFMGLIIVMIFALDHPFRGDLGIGPDSYQIIYSFVKPK